MAGSLARLAIAAGAAAATTSASGYHPRPNHLGVVVTAHEIFVTWLKPAGATAAMVVVRRGEPTCPRTPAQGTATSADSPMHVIDQSVRPGAAYCYTVFLKNGDGTVTTLGNTGLVSVPNVRSVPPSHAQAPPPTLTVSPSRFDSKFAKEAGVAVGAALAGLLVLFLLVRSARRMSESRVVMRPSVRESIAGRNSSALVVPTMIALGWIVVIGFVILR